MSRSKCDAGIQTILTLFSQLQASDVESTLKMRTRNVTLSQLQSTMQRFSVKKLRKIVDHDTKEGPRIFSNPDRFESQSLPDNPPNSEDGSIYPLQGLLHRLVQACNRGSSQSALSVLIEYSCYFSCPWPRPCWPCPQRTNH